MAVENVKSSETILQTEPLFRSRVIARIGSGRLKEEDDAADEAREGNLSEVKIKSLLVRQLIQPLLSDYQIKPEKVNYNSRSKIGPRTPVQQERFSAAIDKIMSELGDKYGKFSAYNTIWLHFHNKNCVRNAEKEFRIYLGVKCDYLPEISKKLIEKLSSRSSFKELKINQDAIERYDNLILYFSENATAKDIKDLLLIIENINNDFKKQNKNIFNPYRLANPWALQVWAGDTSSLFNRIGSFEYFPLRSSKDDMAIKKPNGSIFSVETPNDLYEKISNEAIDFYEKNRNAILKEEIPGAVADHLLSFSLKLRYSDLNKNRDINFSQYIKEAFTELVART